MERHTRISVQQRFQELAEGIHAAKREQQAQGPLHQPSAIEKWLDHDSRRFWDPGELARFRHPHSDLHAGTMNWPNRRLAYSTWESWYKFGEYRRRPPLTAPQRAARAVADRVDNVRGYLHLARMYWGLRGRIPQRVGTTITDNLVGRPFHLRTPSGRRLTEPLLRHAYYVGSLVEHMPPAFWEGAVILEIGAGYGSLARLLKCFCPKVRCVLTDLPERLCLQVYYLLHSFPEASFQVIGDAVHPDGQLSPAADFILAPTWRLGDLSKGSTDLVINTQSMQEMTQAQVDYYLGHIERLCRGYFYCVNRHEKQIGDEVLRHPRDLLSSEWVAVYERPQWRASQILEGLYNRRPAG